MLRVRIWCVLIAVVTKGAYSFSNLVPSLVCPPSSAAREQHWPGKGVIFNRRSNHVSCFFSLSFSGERALASTGTRTTSELRMAATSALSASRRLGKLGTSSTIFFACDIQERFRSIIHNMPAVISTGRYYLLLHIDQVYIAVTLSLVTHVCGISRSVDQQSTCSAIKPPMIVLLPCCFVRMYRYVPLVSLRSGVLSVRL